MVDSPPGKSQFPGTQHDSSRFPKKLLAYFTRGPVIAHPELLAILVIFLVNILLVSPKLMPGFAEINPYDEAKYVESGWLLLHGEIRSLAWGPLVALFYAPAHILIGHSPNWFMLETWVGRFLLFGFMWLSLVYLAFQLKDYASPFITVGLLFVTIPFFLIIENQSDAVFVSLSVLCIANLIAYTRHQRLRNVIFASIFVGLGVLARVETVVLIGTLTVLALAIGWRQQSFIKVLLASILPAAGILVSLFLVNLVNVGNLNLGISNKSYESFEMNQSILTGGSTEQARQEARRLFGTEEENNSSVVRAILRNPRAFGLRIWANVKGVPWSFFFFFGKTQGFILILFSVWGIYTLVRKRAYLILAVLLLWPLHAAIPLGFLAKHVIPQTYYIPMILGAIGMAAALALDSPLIDRTIFLFLSISVSIFCWITHRPAFLYGSILVMAILGITWILRDRLLASGTGRLAPLLLLFAAGLILRDPYPFPDYTTLGTSNEEHAVRYMESSLPARTKILVPFPQPAIAARMVDVTTGSVPKNVDGVKNLWTWLLEQNIKAAYVDSRYPIDKNITASLESGLGEYFDIGYTSPEKVVRVFLVRDQSDK